ncbi:growth hormone secretagogue receptor type 1-like [Lingula anatina]|uniref:Growth hormone secretagogue receptor type 1-like n=1 Tax=Lingula anatina TaxID=7574 RepID=A0A1S3KCK4_LINAN|nr:growth hormone secretagogue receptor type 1-like [Lingula anatina]|eukprot:XP_013419986.1 growth hormone secretagogue receptor type 1-like [Lingula anatina]
MESKSSKKNFGDPRPISVSIGSVYDEKDKTSMYINCYLILSKKIYGDVQRRNMPLPNTSTNLAGAWDGIPLNNVCMAIENDAALYQNLTGDPLYIFAEHLRYYGRPTIYILGLVFNTLAIAVFCRKSLRRTTTCMFMISVAIFDTMNLVNGFFFWIQYDLNAKIMTGSIFLCKLVVFTLYFAPEASAILLSAMSIERYIKIRFPIMARKICSVTKIRVTIVSIVTVLLLINLPVLFAEIYFKLPQCRDYICWNIFHNSPRYITHERRITAYFVDVHKWVAAAIYFVIPTATLLIFNTLIMLQVRKINKESSRMTRNTSMKSQITNMLLVVTFSFLIMTTGYNTIQTGIVDIWGETGTDSEAEISLVFTLFTLLFYLNHASNFFLYCLSGPKYRQVLKQMMLPCLRCCLARTKSQRQPESDTNVASQKTVTSTVSESTDSEISATTGLKFKGRYYGSMNPASASRSYRVF